MLQWLPVVLGRFDGSWVEVMDKLLILNGSFSEIPLIEEAKRLGYRVTTTGNDPSLIGHPYADEYIAADYSDKERILDLVREHDIDRIVSCANDFGVITASYVAEEMGWPGHDTYENAVLLHQKDAFKAFIQELGIRCPASVPFADEQAAFKYAESAEYPIIVKAVDLTGGKGIMRADDPGQAKAAIRNAFDRSRSKHIVIEPFIEGIQQSIDAFVIGGKVVASVSNDTYSPINPYLIQSETLPAKGIEGIQEELHGLIEQICAELDLVDGMFTLQYIVRDGKPYVIEMMRRALGNQFLTVAGAVSGFPWEEALIRAETGMDLSSLEWGEPLAPFVGHHGVMAEREGVVEACEIDPVVESHLFKRIDILQPGDELTDHLNQRMAYLYYAYDDQDEMIDTVSHMNELVRIRFEDED